MPTEYHLLVLKLHFYTLQIIVQVLNVDLGLVRSSFWDPDTGVSSERSESPISHCRR